MSSWTTSTLPADALVAPADFPETTGRGLAVVRDVVEGEELLAIPLANCWYGPSSREIPELAALVASAGDALRDFDATALHLLIERAKGPESSRWAHLQEIPAAYDSTLFWTDAELKELEGSMWLEMAKRFTEEAREDWAALQALCASAASALPEDTPGVPNVLDEHGLRLDDYLWAYATLKSRAAEAVVRGVPGTRLMAPGFDLFNHDPGLTPGTSHRFDEQRACLLVVATRDMHAGEQAYISYGAAGNGSLLLAGGFTLASNRFDVVQLTLSSLVDNARLQTFMMAAPDAPSDASAVPTFEFVRVPDDETISESDAGCAPFSTKHGLTMDNPLPLPLLSYVRLDRLSDDELALHTRRATKEGKQLWQLVRSDAPAPLDALSELVSLGALRDVLRGMLAAYPTTRAADEQWLQEDTPEVHVGGKSSGDRTGGGVDGAPADPAAANTAARRRLAVMLRLGEKRILDASLDALHARLLPPLASLLVDAATQERKSRKAGQAWSALLARRASALATPATEGRIHRAFERLHACELASGPAEGGLLLQSCFTFFVLLLGHSDHPLAPLTVMVPSASPYDAKDTPTQPAASQQADDTTGPAPPNPLSSPGHAAAPCGPGPLPPLAISLFEMPSTPTPPAEDDIDDDDSAAASSSNGALPYLSLYVNKMRFWGAYLLAQWGAARALSVDKMNTMQQEAAGLRMTHSRAVPTMVALEAMCRYGPLVQMGSDHGYWAQLLAKKGCDVLAYDETTSSPPSEGASSDGASSLVRAGGPASAAAHADRALLLIWPDEGALDDASSYATKCLEAYSGQTLLLIGEWHGRALTSPNGNAFSRAFQDRVEASFEVVEQHRLPSWPPHLDALVVWRRRCADVR